MTPAQRRARVRAVLTALVVGIAAFLVARALREPYVARNLIPGGEGQLGVRYWEIARTSLARGDGFPLWDRSQCAGWPFLGNPDTPLFTSLVASVLRLHGDTMTNLWTTIGLAIGISGVFFWVRSAYGLDRVSSFFAGALWVSAGFLSFHVGYRLHMLPFVFLPWVFALARIGERDARAALGAGAVLALTFIEGGLYPVCYGIVALLALQLPRVFARDATAERVFGGLGLLFLAFILIAGVKLYPTLTLLLRHPRAPHETDALKWDHLAWMLGDVNTAGMPALHYHRDEYRAYIGPLAIGAAIAGAGVAAILKPRRFDVLVFLVVSLLLVRGAFAEFAPYVLLAKLPVYGQLNVPARFVVLVHLAAAVCGAFAFDAARRALSSKALALIVVATSIAAFVDPMQAARKMLKDFPAEPRLARPDPPPQAYRLLPNEDPLRKAEYPMHNAGTIGCYKLSLEYPEGNGYVVGPRPQATLEGPGAVSNVVVHQNRTEADVDSPAPTTLHLNQNFDRDFSASIGTIKKSARGTLDVQLPAGAHHVVVNYRPAGLIPGLLATIFGLLLLPLYPLARRRFARRRA